MSKIVCFILLFVAVGCSTVQSGKKVKYVSNVPSTICESSIPNTHVIENNGSWIVRGNAPVDLSTNTTSYKQLYDWGITDVLIFRNAEADPTLITEEYESLLKIKNKEGKPFISRQRIHHIPFPWKDVGDGIKICEQLIEGLSLLKATAETSGRKLYLHCTVGEDRTGLLAGLYRVLAHQWTGERAFQEEMCARGYGAANTLKNHKKVIIPIRKNLTTVYSQMLSFVDSGKLKWTHLDKSVCKELPKTQAYIPLDKLECTPQPTFPKPKSCVNL